MSSVLANLDSPSVSVVLAAGCLALAMAGCGSGDSPAPPARGAGVAHPVLEGPVTGGSGVPFVASTLFDLAQVGYMQEEYFVSGTATAYTSNGALGTDGMWLAEPAATAEYKTRIVVYRPIDPKKFNGTVVVEWLNVSGGLDAAPGWITAHTELIRQGYAWVGVSAQRGGVEGGGIGIGLAPMPLKQVDPQRYGSLTHPGDSFSYDIYSQAARAVRRPRGIRPLGNLEADTLIASGQSQSAFRMVVYINAIHPRDDIYDGFLVHSRGGNSLLTMFLSEPPQESIPVPPQAKIRADLDTPVLVFQTETDLTFFGSAAARQPDTDRFRLWEVAGTAHADLYTVALGATDTGGSAEAARVVEVTTPIPGVISCQAPLNSGPQHFVLKAAFRALREWIRSGAPPPSAPPIEVRGGTAATILRDQLGNALGGVRTPYVDVPIARLTGDGQSGSLVCLLFGTTRLFDAATLASLYPSKEAYLTAHGAATDAAVRAGFILAEDAGLLRQAAAMVDLQG